MYIFMKARYFAAMFVILALFLASGCGGSGGGDVTIPTQNNNTNNNVTSQDQTGNNTNNNDTGTITSQDQPPVPPTTSGDQSGNTNTNNNTGNNTGNTSLTFDSTSYTTGTANGVTYRAYSNITYVANPANESYQQLSIYIPETYISGGTLNGYTASTAPIFMPNGSAGYSAARISTPDRSTSAGAALAKGYVVVSPAIRGRDVSNGTAPACIVDYKAAVRYVRYNASRLPAGNVNRIISCGTSAGGAISLHFSARQEIHPTMTHDLRLSARLMRQMIFTCQSATARSRILTTLTARMSGLSAMTPRLLQRLLLHSSSRTSTA